MTICNRQCWLISFTNIHGQPRYLAAVMWKHNTGHIYTTTQFDDTPEAAYERLRVAIAQGET